MKDIFQHIAQSMSRTRVIFHRPQAPGFEFPFSRAVGIALVACLAAFLLGFEVTGVFASPAMGFADLLMCGLIPLLAAFIILQRSDWHREIAGLARTGRVLFVSCAITGGLLVAFASSIFIIRVCSTLILQRAGGR